jgi:hypothetical protein
MTRFYKKFFTSNLRIWSSFYIFFVDFYFFKNFKTVNSILIVLEFTDPIPFGFYRILENSVCFF